MTIDEAYFAEFKIGVANAYIVGLANWRLFNGVPPVIPTGAVPAEPFRVAITVSAVTGHTTVAGAVSVNGELLTFTRATRLTTTGHLTTLPSITVTGLDCNILVECISVNGAPLKQETLTPIEIICFPKTSIRRDPHGSGSQETNYNVYTEGLLQIGDQIRYPADPHQGTQIDIYVKDVSSAVDLEFDNTQPFRVYYCA